MAKKELVKTEQPATINIDENIISNVAIDLGLNSVPA